MPEEKAFDALKSHHKAKLIEIFKDIDFDDVKAIDMHKAVRRKGCQRLHKVHSHLQQVYS